MPARPALMKTRHRRLQCTEEYDQMDQPEADRCSACISRRAMLRGGAAGALMLALPIGCTASNSDVSGPIPAGNVADVQVGALQAVAGENVILGRDANGLYAMTRVCTHQGQLVSILTLGSTTVLHCYGHGSEFDADGQVIIGPATRPLEHFQVDLAADGSITIQADQFVTADTRTPVG
jgi:nitrite reductase/ring-hydroxylating ferredoxin subunit